MLRGEADAIPDRTLFVRSDTGSVKKAGYQPDPFEETGGITPEWRLVHGRELYRIADDPGQANDLADANPEIVADLRARQQAYFEETRDTYDSFATGARSGGRFSVPASTDPLRTSRRLEIISPGFIGML